MTPVRALIVDDSAMMRSRLRTILTRDVGVEVVGVAYDAAMAIDRIRRLRPQVVVLNAEQPAGDGLAVLTAIRQADPVPVVMVSAYTRPTTDVCQQALTLGACDVIDAALLDATSDATVAAQALLAAVQRAGRGRRTRRPSAEPVANGDGGGRPLVIVIGASTGGTEALREVVSRLPVDVPGIVVVQHMASTFTRAFAERLDRAGVLRVREAYDGAPIVPGQVLIAPGGRHTTVATDGDGERLIVRTHDTPPVNQHRPSIDVLFDSCAAAAGPRAVGVLLTGMGADGADGLATMRLTGAHTIAQDEATSVVFGMPREAIARGGAVEVLPLDAIAAALVQVSRPSRTA